MPGVDEAYRRMTAFDLKHGSRSLLRRLFTNLPTPFEKPGASHLLAWPAWVTPRSWHSTACGW